MRKISKRRLDAIYSVIHEQVMQCRIKLARRAGDDYTDTAVAELTESIFQKVVEELT